MGMAFDSSGSLYVSDQPRGNIYKFGPTGGVANASTKITSTPIGPALGGLAFDRSGHLFGVRSATTGDFFTGATLQIDPSTGTVIRTVASGLTCPGFLTTDPLSGDLFTADICTGAGANNPSIWRISNPSSASPTKTVYVTLPSTPNSGPFFAPNGTLYALSGPNPFVPVVQVAGTNTPSPPAVTTLPGVTATSDGLIAQGAQANGAAEFLILTAVSGTVPTALTILDLITNPPSTSGVLADTRVTGFASGNFRTFANEVLGPDGCVYWAHCEAVYKVTDSAGGCTYTSATPAPTILLTPMTVSPNPAQGTPVTFTATFHYVSVPVDTPVFFAASGANSQVQMVRTNADGEASFTYAGSVTGTDAVVATATVGTETVTSNVAQLTWAAGPHTTFCNLNLSPQGGTVGTPSTLSVSLFDASDSPPAPVTGKTVTLAVGDQSCTAVTDATGLATCALTPDTPGLLTMSASFAGTAQLLGTACSTGFSVLIPLCSPTPATGCQEAATQKASLTLGKGTRSARNRVGWRWTSSGTVGVGDFGSPPTTTDYVLCLYDTAGLEMTARVPADRRCGTRPCWTALGTLGFKYRDRAGIPDGVTQALLEAGSAGQARIAFKGKGASLPLPTLPLTTPVRVQLHQSSSSACWEATYSLASRNTTSAFKAKSD